MKQIPIIKQIWNVIRNGNIPRKVKLGGVIIALLYVILPIDIIPDFASLFFGVGYLDDLVVIGGIFELIQRIWGNKDTASHNS